MIVECKKSHFEFLPLLGALCVGHKLERGDRKRHGNGGPEVGLVRPLLETSSGQSLRGHPWSVEVSAFIQLMMGLSQPAQRYVIGGETEDTHQAHLLLQIVPLQVDRILETLDSGRVI